MIILIDRIMQRREHQRGKHISLPPWNGSMDRVNHVCIAPNDHFWASTPNHLDYRAIKISKRKQLIAFLVVTRRKLTLLRINIHYLVVGRRYSLPCSINHKRRCLRMLFQPRTIGGLSKYDSRLCGPPLARGGGDFHACGYLKKLVAPDIRIRYSLYWKSNFININVERERGRDSGRIRTFLLFICI